MVAIACVMLCHADKANSFLVNKSYSIVLLFRIPCCVLLFPAIIFNLHDR